MTFDSNFMNRVRVDCGAGAEEGGVEYQLNAAAVAAVADR